METKTTLSAPRFVSTQSDFALKINHTLWLLWELRVNVLLLLVICIFYWLTPQGMDILVGLSERGQRGYFRLCWSFVDLGLFAFFQWYVPRYLFGISDGDNKELHDKTIVSRFFDFILLKRNIFPRWLSKIIRSPNDDLSSFGQTIQLHKNIQRNVPRALAVFSVLVVAMGMFRVLALNSIEKNILTQVVSHPLGLFILTLLFTILIVTCQDRWIKKATANWIKWTMLIVPLIPIFLLIFSVTRPTLFTHSYRLLFIGIAQFIFAILFCAAFTIRRRIRNEYLTKNFNEVINLLFSLNIVLVLILYLFFNLDKSDLTFIYPISVLYISLNFFYLIISALIAYRIKNNFYLLTPLLTLLFVFAWINNTFIDLKLHEVDYLSTTYSKKRPSLEQYFSNWVEQRREDISKSEKYPIYIVAGEGGGSRAAFWTNTVLSELHDETNGKFTNHLLAISSVSGSSFGAAAHIAYLEKLKTHPKLKAKRETRIAAFSQNYLSSSIASLLGKDFWITCAPLVNKVLNVRDRAKRLESEWSCYVEKSFGEEAMNIEESVFKNDYLSFWADSSYTIPLYFPNTTRVEDGKRGIISPVVIGEACTDAIDVIGELSDDQSIRLSTAALLSARFPYVNPGGEISGLGHFVDGGYYENAAAQTVQAVWHTCKNTIANLSITDSTLSEKLEFRILLIFNGDGSYHSNLRKKELTNINQLVVPVSSIVNVRSGHTQRSYKLLEKEIQQSPKDTVYVFELDHNVKLTEGKNQSKVIMPLARFLSERAAKGILENLSENSRSHPKVKTNLTNLREIKSELKTN